MVFVVKTFETQWQSTPRTINEWNPITITFAFCQGRREANFIHILENWSSWCQFWSKLSVFSHLFKNWCTQLMMCQRMNFNRVFTRSYLPLFFQYIRCILNFFDHVFHLTVKIYVTELAHWRTFWGNHFYCASYLTIFLMESLILERGIYLTTPWIHNQQKLTLTFPRSHSPKTRIPNAHIPPKPVFFFFCQRSSHQ